MPDINTLITDFFVNVGDPVQAPSSPTDPNDVAITAATLPLTASGSRTTYLIDGTNYFGALKQEIEALKAGGTDKFFYSNSWHLGLTPTPDMVQIAEGSFTSAWQEEASDHLPKFPPFALKDESAGPFHPMQEDIIQMVDAGVDVRLLVWASPLLVNFKKAEARLGQIWAINVHSLQSVLELRNTPQMSNNVVLNTVGHSVGAMHLKMVVCGDSTGFRGYATGMDFVDNRNSPPKHEPFNLAHPELDKNYWHDVAIKVEGSGANGMYHYFEQLWNEQVQRSPKVFKAFGNEIKSQVEDTPLVDSRETDPIADGQQHTQLLRTLPTMNFSIFGTGRDPLVTGFLDKPVLRQVAECSIRIASGFRQRKISFAEDGIFEFRAAQRKAINAAQRYIYIEDQSFENLDIGLWIHDRLLHAPDLKVILLYMGDPLDERNPLLFDFMDRIIVGNANDGNATPIANPEERVVFAVARHTVHSKLTIIDDLWASIGSSNCMRRSFYTDGEISVSVLDEAVPSFAANLRKDLWGEHCGVDSGPARNPLLVLEDALGAWRPSWGTAPPDPSGVPMDLKPIIVRMKIPFAFIPDPPKDSDSFPAPRGTENEIERLMDDGDSRLEY
jgi:phosphatidylserine/phosphatidylglycerophosphate/cardiolipin synthase-like enzyme